jgi:hypothetical protein
MSDCQFDVIHEQVFTDIVQVDEYVHVAIAAVYVVGIYLAPGSPCTVCCDARGHRKVAADLIPRASIEVPGIKLQYISIRLR